MTSPTLTDLRDLLSAVYFVCTSAGLLVIALIIRAALRATR